jgi:outer membrane protein assembly factor BamB
MLSDSKKARSLRLVVLAGLTACAAGRPDTDEATAQVTSALSTTSVTFGGDELRTGWYSDEAVLAPSKVGNGSFGSLFTVGISGQVYAQPLVSNGTLFVATENNAVYGLNAATGKTIWSRTLATAVSSRDLPARCPNIAPTVGVTGTPVIDLSTNVAYLLSKAYVSGSSGAIGYFAHGVNLATGAEVAGFPVRIQGSASNDATQTFDAQVQLQRPGLLLMNGVVYAGFGSHCDQAPAVGWIVGVSTSGQIKTLWTTEAGANKTALGSVWAPGALASDGMGQILLVTGNGISSKVTTGPGTSPPAALPQSAVRLTVQTDGSLKATDYFSPFNMATLDANDWDFGSSSPLLLPSTFGTSAIPHLMVAGSKGGILYFLNRDSLGGRGQGASATDAVIEELGPFSPNVLGDVGLWTKPSVWPGDGGYVYTVETSETGKPTYLRAFAYGLDGSGKPMLTASGRSNGTFGFSSGTPMVTSNGSTAGSALVWVEYAVGAQSSGAQLRAYDAVPVGGVLNERWSAPIGQMANFASPGIAGGRVYVGTLDGRVLGFGALGGGTDAGTDSGTDSGKDAATDSGKDAATDASGGAGCASGATVFSETACSSLPAFNTTGAVCYKFKAGVINGWNASNVQGRTATAKGSTTQGPITPTNGAIANQPGLSAGSDGFVYFNFTAGSVTWSSMACW